MKRNRFSSFLKIFLILMMMISMLQPVSFFSERHDSFELVQIQPEDSHAVSQNGDLVFSDYFNTSLGYNDSLWNLESYGNGSVSWVDGELFNMSAKTHSFRTLSSKQTFEVGHEMSLRMRMEEADTVVCIGWTNQTPTTGWNYLFWGDSVYIEGALSTLLLTHKYESEPYRTFKHLSGIDTSVFHDYRIVWNSSVIIAYVDGVRVGALGGEMPDGPFHFKIAITENRNVDTEGWICLDSIQIREHNSMITENPPFITLNSPGNTTLNLGGDPIDVVPIGSDGALFWSWDGAPNSTSVAPYNIRLPTSEGVHILDVYCKDGYGYNSWAHERYLLKTMVTPPTFDAEWFASSPAIDGIIQTGEWSSSSFSEFNLVRDDGSVVSLDISMGCDSSFFYVAIDSPVPSGHDSRAAVIVTGQPDGTYHGSNVTPVTTAYYTMSSPQAWSGYTELKFLNQTDENTVIQPKIEPVPSGFLASSSEQGTQVHYEFRFPLNELGTTHDSTLGISFMLFPTGMGVHSSYFPIAYPWVNASRLALVRLPIPPDTMLLQVGALGVVGFIAVALYFAYQRMPKSSAIDEYDSELIERVTGIIESYERITIERLSQMTNTNESKVKEIVEQLIDQKKLEARFSDDEVIRGE